VWFFVTKKRHNEVIKKLYGERTAAEIRLLNELGILENLIAAWKNPEAIARWSSPEGKRVLRAFEQALRLIQDYQESLATIMAADPHYREADDLLESWGMKSNPRKIVGGFTGVSRKPPVIEIDPAGKVTRVMPVDEIPLAKV